VREASGDSERGRRSCDWSDEAITPSRDCRYIACAIRAIAEGLAKVRHVKPQTGFFDDGVGPDLRHQLLLVDDLVRCGHQRDQNVEGARTHVDGDALFGEQPFARDQSERTEGQSVLVPTHRCRPGVCFGAGFAVPNSRPSVRRTPHGAVLKALFSARPPDSIKTPSAFASLLHATEPNGPTDIPW
jgi:hypothetical protein